MERKAKQPRTSGLTRDILNKQEGEKRAKEPDSKISSYPSDLSDCPSDLSDWDIGDKVCTIFSPLQQTLAMFTMHTDHENRIGNRRRVSHQRTLRAKMTALETQLGLHPRQQNGEATKKQRSPQRRSPKTPKSPPERWQLEQRHNALQSGPTEGNKVMRSWSGAWLRLLIWVNAQGQHE